VNATSQEIFLLMEMAKTSFIGEITAKVAIFLTRFSTSPFENRYNALIAPPGLPREEIFLYPLP